MAGDWFDGIDGGEPRDGTQGGGGTVYDANGQPMGGGAPTSGTYQGGGQQGGGSMPYSDQAFQEILHRYPPTNDGVRQAYAEAQRVFGANAPRLLDHPERLDKFVLPDGRTIDAVMGAGGGNPSWGWMVEGAGGHGGGAAGGALGNAAAGAGMDPSYEWRFKEGQKAIERSAAAKGTLLTGGTLKALAGYGQGMASTEFGNIFNRNYQLAGLGLNAAQTGAASGSAYSGQAGNTASNYANTQGNLITGRGNATAAGQANRAGIWSNTIGGIAGNYAASPWFANGSGGGGGGSVAPGYNYSVPYPNSPMAR